MIALETLNRVIHRQAVIFILSDFIAADDFSKPIALASRKHDVVAFRIFDPGETSFPSIGILSFEDAETGQQIDLNTSDLQAMEQFQRLEEQRRREQQKLLQSYGVDTVSLRTDEDAILPLRAFFERRERRLAL